MSIFALEFPVNLGTLEEITLKTRRYILPLSLRSGASFTVKDVGSHAVDNFGGQHDLFPRELAV